MTTDDTMPYTDADPSWYPRVMRTLHRDYPKVYEQVWGATILENAQENVRQRTATTVPNEAGELVPAGSLYADKCAECTTGHSCEAAGRCTFEG